MDAKVHIPLKFHIHVKAILHDTQHKKQVIACLRKHYINY